MSGGQLVYLSLMPGGKVKVIRRGFDNLILCGSDGMKMYVIAQRVWRERKKEEGGERGARTDPVEHQHLPSQ